MNHKELKQAITQDIQSIQQLELDIIPARDYYMTLLKLMASGFWKLGLVVFCTIFYACLQHPSNQVLAHEPYQALIGDTALATFFMTLGALLLLYRAFNFYLLFQFHLEKQLQVGALVAKKLRQIAYLFLSAFAILCLLFGSYAESAAIYMMIVLAFVGAAGLTYLGVSMEINRIGMSTVFTLINQYLQKETTSS